MNISNIILYSAVVTEFVAIVALAAKLSDLDETISVLSRHYCEADKQWAKTIKTYMDVMFNTLAARIDKKKDKKEKPKK